MRYANDFGSRAPRWNRAGTYDMDYNAGYAGLENDPRFRDRGMGMGTSGRYDAGFRGRGRPGYERGWTGYDRDFRDVGMRGSRTRLSPYDREYGYGARERYDRDLGDRLRHGWRELKHGVRDAFGRDRDRYGYRRDRW